MGYNTQEFKKYKKDDYVNKNFILVSLEEKKAKKIAEVINNDTSRRIIDHLAKNDATETQLSKDLNMPISTVHYNVKQLQDAGLVVVEEFHYSKKGKEVNHYTLANKYIIIAPKSEDSRFLNALNKILPIAIITAGVAFVMQLFNILNSATKAEVTIAGDNMLRAAAPVAQQVSRPAFQSMPAAYFLVGGISVIIIYFIYELVRKR